MDRVINTNQTHRATSFRPTSITPAPFTTPIADSNGRLNAWVDGLNIFKNNFSATTNPTTSDDNTIGYSVGSVWINISTGTIFTCVASPTGAAVWSVSVKQTARYDFYADQLDNPVTSDWSLNALAAANTDSVNSALTVRLFDDTTAQGAGFLARIPASTTNIVFTTIGRAVSAPGANTGVALQIRKRIVVANATPTGVAVAAWTTTQMTTLTLTNNIFFQKFTQTIPLATLGLSANDLVQFEFVRDAPNATDTLVGNWALLELMLEMT